METHGPMLRQLAESCADSLDFWPYRADGDWVSGWLHNIEARIAAGTLMPFAVHDAVGAYCGITGYLSPDSTAKAVEIGMTMYAPAARGTKVNPAAKRLLLGYAFDQGANRIQFNIDARNVRSQAAVRKLGAVQEGVLRENRKVADGFVRDTVVFSILAREWPAVKAGLDARLAPE